MSVGDDLAAIRQRQIETQRLIAEISHRSAKVLNEASRQSLQAWPLAISAIVVSGGLICFGAVLGKMLG
jgi:hypothetical protein